MALSSSIICVLLCSFVFWYQPSDERCVAGTEQEKQQQKSKGGLGAKKPKGGVGAGAIVGISIVLLLIIGMAAWCVYAYRNPTTKSGLFLIDVSATRLFGIWYVVNFDLNHSSGLSQFCLFSYFILVYIHLL